MAWKNLNKSGEFLMSAVANFEVLHSAYSKRYQPKILHDFFLSYCSISCGVWRTCIKETEHSFRLQRWRNQAFENIHTMLHRKHAKFITLVISTACEQMTCQWLPCILKDILRGPHIVDLWLMCDLWSLASWTYQIRGSKTLIQKAWTSCSYWLLLLVANDTPITLTSNSL